MRAGLSAGDAFGGPEEAAPDPADCGKILIISRVTWTTSAPVAPMFLGHAPRVTRCDGTGAATPRGATTGLIGVRGPIPGVSRLSAGAARPGTSATGAAPNISASSL